MRRVTANMAAFWTVTFVNAAWWLWLQFTPVHDAPANFWFNAAYAVPFFAAAAVLWAVAWRWRASRYSETPPIILLGISLLLYGGAQLAWTYYNLAEGIEVPEFSLADVLYISSVLLRLIAIASLLVHQLRKNPLPRAAVTALVVAAVAASFAGVWGVFGTLRGQTELVTIETFYTLVSFLTLFVAILAINRDRHAELRRFLYLFFFASAAHAGADFFFAVRSRAETYWNGDVADFFYATGALLLYAAALSLPKRLEHAQAQAETSEGKTAFILPLSIALVGLIVSARVGDASYTDVVHETETDTAATSVTYAAALQRSLDVVSANTYASEAFLRGSERIEQGEFARFLDTLTRGHAQEARVAYLDAGNRIVAASDPGMVGRDFVTDPLRQGLLARAMATHSYVASEPVVLATGALGIITLLPLFDGEAYRGAVIGIIRLPELMEGFASGADQEAYVVRLSTPAHEISLDGLVAYGPDGQVAAADPSLPTSPPPSAPAPVSAFLLTEEVAVADQTWRLEVSPTAARAEAPYRAALFAFLATLSFVGAFALIAYLLVTQRARLREQLSLKTRSLDASIADLTRKKHYLDNVSDAVVVKQGGKVAYANSAAATFFGAPQEKAGARTSWPYGVIKADPAAVREALAQGGAWEGEAQAQVGGRPCDLSVSVHAFRPGTRDEAELLIARDVTERKAVERAKTQFVSMVAHQLRAPMTQMRWIVEQLQGMPKLPKEAKGALDDLEEISTVGGKFVGDILNVSRIERGVLQVNLGEVGLKALVSQTLEPLLETAKERGTSFEVSAIPKAAKVHVDVEKAVEALRNVADNATKYSPKGTPVTIAVEREDPKTWAISVSDNGPGIPKEFWGKVFEIKTEVSPGASSGSAGLGLYLTKKFLEAMGGSVSFKTGPKGTTFVVRVPSA